MVSVSSSSAFPDIQETKNISTKNTSSSSTQKGAERLVSFSSDKFTIKDSNQSKTPSFSPQICFVDEPLMGLPDFSQVWSRERSADFDKLTCKDMNQLKTNLGLESFDSKPGLKSFLGTLELQKMAKPENLTYIQNIANKHGLDTMDQIGQKLTDYCKSFPNTEKEQKEILRDTIHDIAIPSNIKQDMKGTCTVTSLQMKLAIEQPVKYADIVTKLAKGENYKLPTGREIVPNNTWKDNFSDGRTKSCRIFQNAMMEFGGTYPDGSKPLGSYDSKKDQFTISKTKGLADSSLSTVIKDVVDSKYETDTANYFDFDEKNDKLPEKEYKEVEDDLMRGRPVSVSFGKSGQSGHEVLVVGVDKTGKKPKVIMNSWGSQYSMESNMFKKQLKQFHYIDDRDTDGKKTPLIPVPEGAKIILGDTKPEKKK